MKNQPLSAISALIAGIILTIAAALSSDATVITWTNAASGNWNTAANWNPNQVPTTTDTAVINTNGITVTLDGSINVGGIVLGSQTGCGSGGPTLNMNGQNLFLNGTFMINACGQYTVDSGVLVGNTTNAVMTGVFNWTGGRLAGTLTFATGSILTIAGSGGLEIHDCTVTNRGTVNWVTGILRGGSSGTAIYNYGIWNMQGDVLFNDDFGGAGSTIFNHGTLRKSAGVNSASFQNVFLNNDATLDIQTGTLSLQGGGNLLGGGVTGASGNIQLASGNFNINGMVTTTNVQMVGGSLAGNNVIAGGLTWVNGIWNSVPVTIATNCVVDFAGNGNLDILTVNLTNFGTVIWSSGHIRAGGGGVVTAINNYGLWDNQNDLDFGDDFNGSGTVFTNFGTFRKSGGLGTMFMENGVTLVNYGTIDPQSGTISLRGGASLAGGNMTGASGILELANGPFNINGMITAANVHMDGGGLFGNNVIAGSFTWQNGVWNGVNVTIATNCVVNLAGNGNLDMNTVNLTNFGTMSWTSGHIRAGGGGPVTLLNNYGLFDFKDDLNLGDDFNGSGTIITNYGIFRKSGGPNTAVVANGITFVNYNLVDVQTGALSLQGGGNFLAGKISNATGLLQLAAGGFNLNGTITTTNTQFIGGSLVGNNVFIGGFTWGGSGIWNDANVTISTNCLLILDGNQGNTVLDMARSLVTNYGNIVWVSGRIRVGGGGPQTILDNYGTFDWRGDFVLGNDFAGSGTVITNFGILRKSAGTNTAVIGDGVTLFNYSTIDVQTGTLSLQGGANLLGGTATNPHGILQLANRSYNLNGMLTSTNVQFVSGNFVGDNVITGGFTWDGNGIWNDANVTISTNCLLILDGNQGNTVLDMARSLVTNYGNIVWVSGRIRTGGGGPQTILDNYGTFDWRGDFVLGNDFAGSGTVITNFGILRKSAGTNTAVIGDGAFVINYSTIDVQTGTLSLQGGGNFLAGTVTNSHGILQLSTHGYTINGTVTSPNVQLVGGNFVGNNIIHGGLTWINGILNDAAITVATNSTFDLAGNGVLNMARAALTNFGTVNWTAGHIRTGGGGPETIINNYGLWDSQADLDIGHDFSGSATVFTNFGTFRKSSGAGFTTVDTDVSFFNFGTVAALTGSINFNTTPDFSAGKLTFGFSSPTNFGVINAGGNVPLGGAIGAVLLNGYSPSVGTVFDVLNFAAHTGVFTDFTALNAGSGVAFTPTLAATSLTLTAAATNFTSVGPTIISQPMPVTANYGDTVKFQVAVSGSATLTYQWSQDNKTINGATSATLTLSNIVFTQAGNYTVLVSNSVGSVLSQSAQLIVNPVLPSFTQNPQPVTVPQGSNATFTVAVAGEPPPTVRWLRNGGSLFDGGRFSGATTTMLMISNVQTSDIGDYSVVASNAFGMAVSGSAALHVNFSDLSVTNITAPLSAAIGQNVALIFTITNNASGTAYGPWLDEIRLAADTNGTGAQSLGNVQFAGTIPGFSSATVTQTVIMPANVLGPRFFGVVVDSGNNVLETTKTNNTNYAVLPITVNAVDLALTTFSAPPSAQFGQTLSVSYSVTNLGTASATAAWNDRIYFSSFSNSLNGATLLATIPGSTPLAASAGYSRTQSVTLPVNPHSAPGTFYLLVLVDADNVQLESIETNNQLISPISISLPPLADLVVGKVSAPLTATAGQSIPISWTTTNIGPAFAAAPWIENVYLLPANVTLPQFSTNIGAYPLIGSFTISSNLAAAASITRTQQVAIPTVGLAGDLRVAVIVDVNNDVLEQSSSNNIALGTNDIQVPLVLTLALPVQQVPENVDPPFLNGSISRDGDISVPLVVTLHSSATDHLLVDATVTIPAGSASAPFTATVVDDGVPGTNVPVTINASAANFLGASAQVIVANTEFPTLTLSLPVSDVTMGQTITATLTSSTVSNQPVMVNITASTITGLTSPTSVTIPANTNSVTFKVLANQTPFIAPAQVYTIGATSIGYVSSSAQITVLNNNAPVLILSLDRTNISEADGPLAITATLTRLPVGDQPVTIALSSDNTGAARVPAQIVIPAFQTNGTFNISAVNDTNITGQKTALISAQTLDSGGNLVGATVSQRILVQDADGPSLKVTIANKVVAKGLNPATTATISTTSAPPSNLIVTLTSGNTNEATVPATVTILAGQTNATFNIASANDNVPLTSQLTTITATATNYAPGSDVLTISDLTYPDLVVSSIAVPGSVLNQDPLQISFRLLNQGLGALLGSDTENIYLTTDPNGGSRMLMGSTVFPGPLAPGQHVDESLVIPGNQLPAPGTYYVVVVANANSATAELNQANDTLIGATPIVIAPEYTATVQAGVTTVLAGTPIPLSGSATLAIGGPAANKPVNILINVRGFQRTISANTDNSGNFTTVFNPMQSEAGAYTAAAVCPGVVSAPAQTQFNILGMSAAPTSTNLTIIQGANVTGTVSIQNLGDIPLNGLTATASGLPANLTANVNLSSNVLSGMSTITLSYTIGASDASILQSSFTIHLMSAEGAVLDFPVTNTVVPLTPRLEIAPSQIASAMVRGAQKLVNFNVVNVGGAPTGPLNVNLPAVPWLSVASTNPIPSIAPGATNIVTLLLSPSANMPLGPYTGTLALTGNGLSFQAPFAFTAVSDAHGSLQVESVDEYTFFAAGSPPLTNATVTVLDPFTQVVLASGRTDSNGLFTLTNLTEGVYELDLSSPQHVPFRGEAQIVAGQTNSLQAFLSRQTVTFVWTVDPIKIKDTNEIVITTEFEANVPAPVIVPSPASIDVASITTVGQTMVIPFTLSNQGLIAVHDVAIALPTSQFYSFEAITTQIGDLPAHGTVTIPIRITRLAGTTPQAQSRSLKANVSPQVVFACGVAVNVNYDYTCGTFGVSQSVGISVQHVVFCDTGYPSGGQSTGVSCGVCGSGSISIYNPNNGGIGGGVSVRVPPGLTPATDCDSCYASATVDCLIGFIPVVGCVYSVIKTCVPEAIGTATGGGGAVKTVEDCTFSIIGCALKPVYNILCCIQGIGSCKCGGSLSMCVQNLVGGSGGGPGGGPKGAVAANVDPVVGNGLNSHDLRDVYVARTYVVLQFASLLLNDNDGRWFSSNSGSAFSTFMDGFIDSVQPESDTGPFISPQEATNLLALPYPNTVTAQDVQAVIARWNLSVTNWKAGIFSPSNTVAGADTNFIDLNIYTNMLDHVADQYQASQAAGFDSPVLGLFFALQQGAAQGGTACAHVVLQIDQSAVLTRDAFHAKLQLNNGSSDLLSSVKVSLVVQTQDGQDVTSLFGIEAPTVDGNLTAVDGTGALPASSTGDANWTIVPTIDAAPIATTNYLVSGTFSYVENGVVITIPLAPAPITVQPSPQLFLKYFLQRDVIGDDPFTPDIEPSIPFPLAVLVENKGFGDAQDFQITTAQPQIIDNEKGLLINFNIIGTQISGQPVTPSLTADFGDIAPQSDKVGVFLLQCSLQGLFIGYGATFQHIDPLGNPRLSLIQGVEIHELIHMVHADGSFEDGLPDFLCNEIPNFGDLPDTLFMSDGSVMPVSVVQNGSFDITPATNNLQTHFTATFPAGFTYVVVHDPGDNKFILQDIQRPDGSSLLPDNFYLSNRKFNGLGQEPLRQNDVHFFDYNTNSGPVTYTLVYSAPPNLPDTTPPISSMFTLPAQSPPTFGVAWSGADIIGGSGLAYFDIFSSDNGGTFTNWQSHTVANGATFNGLNGHTYSFYSIATDNAGNREAIPAQPQAQTAINVTNFAPTISVVPTVTINAGQTLTLNVTAGDLNLFDVLSFTLGPGAPAGVQVNPFNGTITWTTSPAQLTSTNPITVIVTDVSGQPPLSASATVNVIVQHVINPPVLAAITNYTISDGTLLTFTASATDSNSPPLPITFSLGVGAPNNASINPTTGVFTWRPLATQAPSTNNFTVIAADNSTPALTATQHFTVTVRRAQFEFLLGIGSTNVMAGSTNSVPVNLQSSLPLTNITTIMQVLGTNLLDLTLQASSPEVSSTLLQPIGSNLYALTLTLNPSLSPGDNRTLAQFGFTGAQLVHSAVVPLVLSDLEGVQTDGTDAASPATSNGRIFVIGREPILDASVGSNSSRMFTLYGKLGSSYELDYATNLTNGNWHRVALVPMTNTYGNFGATNAGPQVYYRAFEFFADPPILQFQSTQPGNLGLLMYGLKGSNYQILSSTNLSSASNWTNLSGFSLSNSFQFLGAGSASNQQQYFRAKRP